MAVTNDPLCLQDGDENGAISGANTLEEAIELACLELCRGRPDLLVYALWSPKAGEPLRPLGKLFGDDAINHGELAGTLFRLGSQDTTLTTAVLRLGRPVWTAAIPRFGWHGLAAALRTHGLRSAGAFPVALQSRMAAVLQVFSFDRLQCDLATEALAQDLAEQISERFRLQAV